MKNLKSKMVKIGIIWLLCVFSLFYLVGKKVDDNGGIKKILIETGKDIKEIKKEIEKD